MAVDAKLTSSLMRSTTHIYSWRLTNVYPTPALKIHKHDYQNKVLNSRTGGAVFPIAYNVTCALIVSHRTERHTKANVFSTYPADIKLIGPEMNVYHTSQSDSKCTEWLDS